MNQRKTAKIIKDIFKRLMLCPDKEGTYLFLYKKEQDSPADADFFFETTEDALEYINDTFKLVPNSWQHIPLPLKKCQQDWVANVRVKGSNVNKPEFGKFEKLSNNEWIEISQSELL